MALVNKADKKFKKGKYEEAEKLFLAVDTSTDLGKRDYLLLMLLYDTGVRVSELLDIKINNIDFVNKSIKILGKGNKERIVYFTNDTLNLLKEYIYYIYNKFEERNNFLFSNKKGLVLTRVEVYNIISKYSERAGINKKVSPHTFRHSLATHLLQNDADILSVKTILGHSKVSTTQIYTHITNEELKQNYKDFEIILVDDGSTDNTKEVVENFIKERFTELIENEIISDNNLPDCGQIDTWYTGDKYAVYKSETAVKAARLRTRSKRLY